MIKFFSFADFGVSAIIVAKSRESAIECYVDKLEGDKNLSPKEINSNEALTYFVKAMSNAPYMKVLEVFYETIRDFEEQLDKGIIEYEILLLESWLC